MLQLIMLGRTIAILPRSLVEPVHPGLVCVPVTDATTSRLVVAWSQLDRRSLVASFADAAVSASVPHPDASSEPEHAALPADTSDAKTTHTSPT